MVVFDIVAPCGVSGLTGRLQQPAHGYQVKAAGPALLSGERWPFIRRVMFKCKELCGHGPLVP